MFVMHIYNSGEVFICHLISKHHILCLPFLMGMWCHILCLPFSESVGQRQLNGTASKTTLQLSECDTNEHVTSL